MNETAVLLEPTFVRHLKFYLFISIECPSISTAIYVLYRFFRSYEIRSRLNNHSIIALLFTSCIAITTELPITLRFLKTGNVQPKSKGFCLFWIWYNFSLQSINLFLMAWLSIERHILIFHSNLIQTSVGKIKWHYIPLSFSMIYIPLFYFFCIFIYSCENSFNYSLIFCGSICYNDLFWLASYDWIINIFIPAIIIPFASIILLIRVLMQKKRMKRTVTWKTTRKMTIQLMSISSVYSIFWVLYGLAILIRLYFIPTFLDIIILYYLQYLPYIVQLLMPIICFACLPELWPRKIRIAPVS
ncbi:unnamed protein product [Adineta steineri]|uniref:G-protein coupled receptors family 1 profile domain-containing protein n=1 Tax=Adineta steineri TaxID=433720 RepID=A0A814PMT6_9BILA|nr:unnamed protein product [Adineta steineri]CAF1108158.1 unnamed protein product [Adineta steineri]CAF3650258.1 unnamed protein product [Adineta steineri]CAF3861786.1 unnamed protein product [Adineta steineri]